MASERIYTVFISSTFEDLREERAEVQKSVLRLNCLPIGMELFPSADTTAWDFIKTQIERSDYYVLIIGARYGSVADDGVSYTEKEYRYAKEKGIPCIVFVRSDNQPIIPKNQEKDENKRKKLQSFIAELNLAKLAQRYESSHQLGGDAYYSLNELMKTHPSPGYIRVSESMVNAEPGVDTRYAHEALQAVSG